jgi:hypothetical protein
LRVEISEDMVRNWMWKWTSENVGVHEGVYVVVDVVVCEDFGGDVVVDVDLD